MRRFWMLVVTALTLVAGAQAEVQRVTIRCRISNSDGTPARGAYVGLAREDQPWSRPEAEKVTTTGEAELTVRPGTYRMMAVSGTGGVDFHGPFNVVGNMSLQRSLGGTEEHRGEIRDVAQRPLEGTTVAHPDALIEPPLGRLSVMAWQSISPAWQAATSADGRWTLRLPTGTNMPLVAQAPTGSAWITTNASSTLTIPTGGGVVLKLDRAERDLVVTLLPDSSADPVSSDWYAQLWARHATGTTITWRSLPPGEYRVWCRPADPAAVVDAIELAHLRVEPRSVISVSASLPKFAAVKSYPVLLRQTDRTELNGLQAYGSRSDTMDRLAIALEDVTSGTVVHVEETTSNRVYGVADTAIVDLGASPTDARKFAAARAGLHIRTVGTEPRPSTGIADFSGCNGSVIQLPLSVRSDGTVMFPAPAKCDAIVLRFAGFSPLIMARTLQPDTTTWLGEHTLFLPGTASIHVTNEKAQSVAGAFVTIAAQVAPDSQAVEIAAVETGADGWAHFSGLPATRALTARARQEDGSTSSAESFRVLERGAISIDPLVISSAATVVLKPRLSQRFLADVPDAVIHGIVVQRESDDEEKTIEQALAGADRVTFHNLLPGTWRVTALVEARGVFHPVPGDTFEARAGQITEVEAEFSPLFFTGQVIPSDFGMGMIDIRGSEMTDVVPSVRIENNGTFRVVLPRRDTYQVDIRSMTPKRLIWIGDVAFTDTSRPVEIRLPTGTAVVKVTMDDRPVPSISVTGTLVRDGLAGMQVMRTMAVTDDDGSAIFQSLLAGHWVFDAGTARGGRAEADIAEEGREVIAIALDSEGMIRGVVTEASGAPVAGAKVSCIGDSPMPDLKSTTTADDGSFELSGLSGRVARCSALSFLGLEAFIAHPGEARRITLPARPGAVHIQGLDVDSRFVHFWLQAPDGRIADVTPFLIVSGDDASLQISAMPPGQWSLCRVQSAMEWYQFAAGRAGTVLLAFSVKDGERKTFDVE